MLYPANKLITIECVVYILWTFCQIPNNIGAVGAVSVYKMFSRSSVGRSVGIFNRNEGYDYLANNYKFIVIACPYTHAHTHRESLKIWCAHVCSALNYTNTEHIGVNSSTNKQYFKIAFMIYYVRRAKY